MAAAAASLLIGVFGHFQGHFKRFIENIFLIFIYGVKKKATAYF